MKRTLAAIMASAMMLFALAGCSGGDPSSESTAPNDPPEGSSQAAEPVTISVGVPTAPPALPVLRMLDGQLLDFNTLWVCAACALVALAVGLVVFRSQQDKFILHI